VSARIEALSKQSEADARRPRRFSVHCQPGTREFLENGLELRGMGFSVEALDSVGSEVVAVGVAVGLQESEPKLRSVEEQDL